ncbi:MAG TPA: hypothetical protein VH539_09080 [Gemmatimonadaceae bacterium]|jgi:hypothetical protein
MRDVRTAGIAKILIAVAAAAALGGCFHVPMRAIQNGRELGYQAESMVIYGQHNPRATRQMSSMLQSSSHGWQYTAKPYSPFGNWDY